MNTSKLFVKLSLIVILLAFSVSFVNAVYTEDSNYKIECYPETAYIQSNGYTQECTYTYKQPSSINKEIVFSFDTLLDTEKIDYTTFSKEKTINSTETRIVRKSENKELISDFKDNKHSYSVNDVPFNDNQTKTIKLNYKPQDSSKTKWDTYISSPDGTKEITLDPYFNFTHYEIGTNLSSNYIWTINHERFIQNTTLDNIDINNHNLQIYTNNITTSSVFILNTTNLTATGTGAPYTSQYGNSKSFTALENIKLLEIGISSPSYGMVRIYSADGQVLWSAYQDHGGIFSIPNGLNLTKGNIYTVSLECYDGMKCVWYDSGTSCTNTADVTINEGCGSYDTRIITSLKTQRYYNETKNSKGYLSSNNIIYPYLIASFKVNINYTGNVTLNVSFTGNRSNFIQINDTQLRNKSNAYTVSVNSSMLFYEIYLNDNNTTIYNMTIDTTFTNSSSYGPVNITNINCTSCQNGIVSPYATEDTTPTFSFNTTNWMYYTATAEAYCRISSKNISYSAMNSSRDCLTGQGTTGHICTMISADELILYNDKVYIACVDLNTVNERKVELRMNVLSLDTNATRRIEDGIESSIVWPGATVYNNQKVYLRNINNNVKIVTVDKVVVYGNQRWLIHYENATEPSLGLFNLTPVVYVLELKNISLSNIPIAVANYINSTKI